MDNEGVRERHTWRNFIDNGFRFICVGSDLPRILTRAGAYMRDVETITGKRPMGTHPATRTCDRPEGG